MLQEKRLKFIPGMKNICSIFLLFLLAVTSAMAAPQSSDIKYYTDPAFSYHYFIRYQSADGLPGNTVSCSVQDNDGFIWIGTNGGVCRYDGSSFHRMGDTEDRMSMSGVVESLFVDDKGLLWFSTTFGKGAYDPVTGEIIKVEIEDRSAVNRIVQDGGNNIWLCSNNLYKYNKSNGEITRYPANGSDFISVAVDGKGQLWCTCSDGRLLRYDSLVDKFSEEPYRGLELLTFISGDRLLASTSDGDVVILDPRQGTSGIIFDFSEGSIGWGVTSLLERVPGEIWIGTRSGIFLLDEETGQKTALTHSDSEQMSVSSNHVTSLSTDREGNVWVGTHFKGLNLWRNNNSAFFLFYPYDYDGALSGNIVRAITVADSIIWIGTEDGGLNSLNPGENHFHSHTLPGIKNNYQDILSVGGELWITTDGNGIFRFDPLTSTVIRHYRFSNNRFFRLLRTSRGDILASSPYGVFRYVPDEDRFEVIPETENIAVLAMTEDTTGRIWLGTTGNGIFMLDLSLKLTDRMGHFSRVTSLFEDSSRRMWVTTEGGGLDVYEFPDLIRHRVTRFEGLPADITCSAIEDSDGLVWVSSVNGLFMIDPSDFHVSQSYFAGTQFENIIYTYGAVCKTGEDSILMGTTDGLLSFSPSKMKPDGNDNSLLISAISGISGVSFKELSSPGRTAAYSDRIVADYKDVSSLSINYSCRTYSNILSPQYKYTFSSRNGEISAVTRDQSVTLLNVGYGKHVFTVSVVGSTNPGSTKLVNIIVRPPFIRSVFAKVLSLLFVLLILSFIGFIISRSRKEKRLRQNNEFEIAKQKEMYESMNSFFMQITHEIRTPLTLIKMPLDRIIKSGKYSDKDLKTIQSNTNRLLSLANQLLDIRKLEQREEKLEFIRQDICEIVRRTCGRFTTMAEDQEVTMNISIPDGTIDAMCARDSIQKIVSNLLSNALKYGGDTVLVSLTETNGKAELRVDSNGDRIPAANSGKIFEKFFQGGKGTGLGLPLARALAELHGGKLYLDVSRTDMNSFVLELPLEHPESLSIDRTSTAQDPEMDPQFDGSRRCILIVEDDQDFRLYLAEALSAEFNVFMAVNGRAALDKLSTQKIDLIVSDIMMPLMDGCELCNHVKSTFEYSHIPIILLTAAVGMETRIETLEVGADGYIEKPFPIELLMSSISNIFKNREIAYHLYASSPLSLFKRVTMNKMEEEVMSRLNDILNERICESGLGIDDLSSALNMSNSTLYRKVKANTGMNVSEYIRVFRLKRAAELLASKQYRVNEVADMVGFSSSSYFSSNFQKQFNISPSAFVKNLGK